MGCNPSCFGESFVFIVGIPSLVMEGLFYCYDRLVETWQCQALS